MCGIFGYIANGAVSRPLSNGSKWYDTAVEDAFKEGLMTMIPRGSDAAGIFTIPRYEEDEVDYYKRALNVTDFFQLDRTKRLLMYPNDLSGVVGHVRKSTVGSDKDNNAHPHMVGNTIMIHNGTLTNYNSLVPTADIFQSDSLALCNAIDVLGPVEAFAKAEGAYAVVMYDIAEKRFRFIRNDERPLWFCYIDSPKVLMFSSEKIHLEWILKRNNLVAKDNQFYQPNPDVLIEVNVDDVHDIVGTKIIKEKKSTGAVSQQAQATKSQSIHSQKKQRDKDAEEIFDALGYEEGQLLRFWAYEWSPYRNNTLGTVRGTLDDDGFDQCVCYAVESDMVYDQDTEQVTSELMCGYVVHAKYEQQGKAHIPVIVLKDVQVYDEHAPVYEGEYEEDEETPKEAGAAYIADEAGNLITIDEFLKIANKNCSCCGGRIFADDARQSAWLSKAFISDGQTGLCCPVCVEKFINDPHHGDGVISHKCVTN